MINTAYQAFMELAGEILPKDNQISLNTNHDELGANLQVTIELPNVSVDDCLQWHEKLLEQWINCKEFDLNILFDVMPAKNDNVIYLNNADWNNAINLLNNPPSPNDKMKALFERGYKNID